MIEILPNFHPTLVHFTVALFSISTLLFVTLALLGKHLPENLNEQLRAAAYWNLWLSIPASIFTVLAGFYAYNTVAHDVPSHAAMTEHRNWAIAAFILLLLAAGWSILRVLNHRPLGHFFVGFLLVTQAVLFSTAWHGGELVYRYGLGVLSLPQAEVGGDGDGHEHTHGDILDEQSASHTDLAESKGRVKANSKTHDEQPHGHENNDVAHGHSSSEETDKTHSRNSQAITPADKGKTQAEPIKNEGHSHTHEDLLTHGLNPNRKQ